MSTKPRRVAICLTWTLFLCGALRAEELGRVHYRLPGLPTVDARSEAVESGTLVRTLDEAAIVHLDNGQVLRLDGNTAVRLDSAPADDVRVTVLSGRVLKWAVADGRALEAGAGSWFVLGTTAADPLTVEMLLLAEPELASKRGEPGEALSGRSTDRAEP